MRKIFLDSDVWLDLLLERKPFVDDISEIIEESLSSNIRLCISPITVTNINYIVGKLETAMKAKVKRKKILEIVKVENVGHTIVEKASDSNFKDFEDAIQNYCAEGAGHKILITRNTKDYKKTKLAVMTPKEYLAKQRTEEKYSLIMSVK